MTALQVTVLAEMLTGEGLNIWPAVPHTTGKHYLICKRLNWYTIMQCMTQVYAKGSSP